MLDTILKDNQTLLVVTYLEYNRTIKSYIGKPIHSVTNERPTNKEYHIIDCRKGSV